MYSGGVVENGAIEGNELNEEEGDDDADDVDDEHKDDDDGDTVNEHDMEDVVESNGPVVLAAGGGNENACKARCKNGCNKPSSMETGFVTPAYVTGAVNDGITYSPGAKWQGQVKTGQGEVRQGEGSDKIARRVRADTNRGSETHTHTLTHTQDERAINERKRVARKKEENDVGLIAPTTGCKGGTTKKKGTGRRMRR